MSDPVNLTRLAEAVSRPFPNRRDGWAEQIERASQALLAAPRMAWCEPHETFGVEAGCWRGAVMEVVSQWEEHDIKATPCRMVRVAVVPVEEEE